MRFFGQSRWRKSLFMVALIAIVIGGGWIYLIASRNPINVVNYRKLDSRTATRADVERLFGPPTSPVRIVQPRPYEKPFGGMPTDFPDYDPWWTGLDIPGFVVVNNSGEPVIAARRIGDLMPGRSERITSNFERPLWVEVCTWDGPEAQIIVSFDDKGKIYGDRVQGRMRWRTKVQEWVSWLK